MTIHSEDPFAVPVDQRDPVRRLRGRLVSPVTIVTAGSEHPAGLTVSSFLVIEGDQPRAVVLLGKGSDFLTEAEAAGAFVAHVLTDGEEVLAEVFAGLRPAPGGMFAGRAVESTAWGPRLAHVNDWAGCRLEQVGSLGDQILVTGIIEELSVSELSSPLIHFRGSYRRLAP